MNTVCVCVFYQAMYLKYIQGAKKDTILIIFLYTMGSKLIKNKLKVQCKFF